MNHIPDAELALYAGNDFTLNEHLRECAECRSRLQEFEAARGWLKDTVAEPSDAQVQALRNAVLQAIAPRRHFYWWMAAAAAVAALLAVFSGIRYFSPAPRPVSAPMLAMTQLPALERATIPLKLPRAIHRTRLPRPEQQSAAMTVVSENGGSPIVRLKTSDPNVIVLWVLNTPPKEGNTHE